MVAIYQSRLHSPTQTNFDMYYQIKLVELGFMKFLGNCIVRRDFFWWARLEQMNGWMTRNCSNERVRLSSWVNKYGGEGFKLNRSKEYMYE